MPALAMTITDAGLDAIVDAQNGATAAVSITQIGLTSTIFVQAPTLTALPGEFRRIDSVGGQAVAENVLHVTAYDTAAISYDVTGFGLYAADGTLIAVYSALADPILSKAALATSMFAVDIVIAQDMAAVIELGAMSFSNPPATEAVAGVARIADDAQADAGIDDLTMMTPAKTRRLIDVIVPAGVILMWSGAIAAVPVGWHLCDGSAGTPDLRDRFIIGAGAAHAPGVTGGALSHAHGGATGDHALTEAQLPAHKHANGVTDAAGGADMFPYGSTASPATPDSINNDAANGAIQGWTSTVGGGEAHNHPIAPADHLPPFLALAFIMKL